MDAAMVMDMLDDSTGRQRIQLLNAQAAHALYACLIQGGKGRIAQMAEELEVSTKTIYAWCANSATAPVAALQYCWKKYEDSGCLRAMTGNLSDVGLPLDVVREAYQIVTDREREAREKSAAERAGIPLKRWRRSVRRELDLEGGEA